MVETISQRRMAENQSVFRSFNQKVQKSLEKINKVASEEGSMPMEIDNDMIFSFCCECSDENCTERIDMSLGDYKKAHSSNDTFSIVCGHEVPSIENITFKSPTYCIVKKHEAPPKSADKLNNTPLHN